MVTVNAHERNEAAREACLRHYGARCFVCGMVPELTYGPDFQGMIHVHHLNPLASSGGVRSVDPVQDLRPVCPNCHTAIHRGDPMHKPEDLKRMLKE